MQKNVRKFSWLTYNKIPISGPSAVDQKSEVSSIEILIPGKTFELRLDQQLIQKTRLWFNCRFEFRFEKI